MDICEVKATQSYKRLNQSKSVKRFQTYGSHVEISLQSDLVFSHREVRIYNFSLDRGKSY